MSADTEENLPSVPSTIIHVQEILGPSDRDHDAAQAVAAGLRDAKATNTRRAYVSAWKVFFEWTVLTDRKPMPAEPQTVALYLGRLAADGKAMVTIDQARAAISHAHAAEGIPKSQNPARHQVVAETLKGWRNNAPAPKQADALTAEALARIRETGRLPRRGRGGRMESAAVAQARGTVDLAIIGVMADGGLRRSEASALTWSDIEFWPDGSARITIRKGKNQPEPATVAVTETTTRALREIQPDGDNLSQPVFGLTGETLANRIRAAAKAAGLGDGFSGHSGRIGAERGGPEPRAMEERQYGGPVHPGRGCRGGAEVADLTSPELVTPFPPSDNPAEAAMTDSPRPVCDSPIPAPATPRGTPKARRRPILRFRPSWTLTTAPAAVANPAGQSAK